MKTGTADVWFLLQDGGQETDGDAAVARESRAARRRPGRLRAAAEASCAADPAEAAAGAPPRRLETHIWHAKRFKMQDKYACTASTRPRARLRPSVGVSSLALALESGASDCDDIKHVPVDAAAGGDTAWPKGRRGAGAAAAACCTACTPARCCTTCHTAAHCS